jgi:hypothetical protein
MPRIFSTTRTPTPTISFRIAVPEPHVSPQFLRWIATRLTRRGIMLGPVGQQILGEYFACGKAQPGKMRLSLPRVVAAIEGREKTLPVHTEKAGVYASTELETKTLLDEVKAGVVRGLAARRVEDRLSVEELGVLAGEFYARNRNGNDPTLMAFLNVVEQELLANLSDPIDLYVGAGIAYKRRATEIANIVGYIDAVICRFGLQLPDDRVKLSARVAFVITGTGPFDESLMAGIAKHNKFEAAPIYTGKMAAKIFRARRDDVGKAEPHFLSWLDKSGYNVEQTADFLSGMVGELGYDVPDVAKLIITVAKRKNYKTMDTKAILSTRVSSALEYKGLELIQYTKWLAKHHYFEYKHG